MSENNYCAEHIADIARVICDAGGDLSDKAFELSKCIANGEIDVEEAVESVKEIYNLKDKIC